LKRAMVCLSEAVVVNISTLQSIEISSFNGTPNMGSLQPWFMMQCQKIKKNRTLTGPAS
jgi:hypothetical protein